MAKRWKGTLAIEGVQTGDGRIMAAGAIEWPDGPLPLAWLKASMHGDLSAGAVDIGHIEEITREDPNILGKGIIDDGHEDGAEFVRRLEEGTAPHGNKWGLSIDPDDWAFEVVDTAPETDDGVEDTILLACSGKGIIGLVRAVGPVVASAMLALVAAAGDPDDPEAEIVYSEDVGRFIHRFTRLRVRGVTAVQLPAIEGSYLELDVDEPAAVAASAQARPAPSASYFSIPEPAEGDERLIAQPTGGYAVPLTIGEPDADGWRPVFGHLGHWGQCHVGFPDNCRTIPASPSDYAEFRLHAHDSDAGEIAVGPLLMGCDHASTDPARPLSLKQARDHYANTGLAWASVVPVDGQWGPWISGVVHEDVTDHQLRSIKRSGWSGDWRPMDGRLDLCAIQSVPTPGFPQLRLVASAGASTEIEPWGTEIVLDVDGNVAALLVASAAPQAHGCGCGGMTAAVPALDDLAGEIYELLHIVERRTRHLVKVEAAALAASASDD